MNTDTCLTDFFRTTCVSQHQEGKAFYSTVWWSTR